MTKSDHVRELIRSDDRIKDVSIAEKVGCTRQLVSAIRTKMGVERATFRKTNICRRCGEANGRYDDRLCVGCKEEWKAKKTQQFVCPTCNKSFIPKDRASVKRNRKLNPDYLVCCSHQCASLRQWHVTGSIKGEWAK